MSKTISQDVSDWITPQQAAKILDCSRDTIISMVRDGLIEGKKEGNRWLINLDNLQAFADQRAARSVTPSNLEEIKPPEVDAGMIEVSIALTGISAAIAALLPTVPTDLGFMKISTAFLAGLLSLYSAYSALWLLARYLLKKTSKGGFPEIWELLRSFNLGPYWFMALGLGFWFVLSFLLSFLVIVIAIGGQR